MYLYLRTSSPDGEFNWLAHPLTAELVALAHRLHPALLNTPDTVTAPAPQARWGYLTDDGLMDIRHKHRIHDDNHRGKTFLSKTFALSAVTPPANTRLVVGRNGVRWQAGPLRTKRTLSLPLLARLAQYYHLAPKP